MRTNTLQSPFHRMPEKSVEIVNTAERGYEWSAADGFSARVSVYRVILTRHNLDLKVCVKV